jgi:flagellar basal body-associated protein FliL
MLFHHKKRSLFPLILALLTLGLIGLMVLSFSGQSERKPAEQNAPDQEVVEEFEGERVDDNSYATTMRDALRELPEELETEPDNLKKLVKIEDALKTALDTKVPADKQSTHLEIALALKQMERGLRNETDAYQSGLEELRALISNNEWLQ